MSIYVAERYLPGITPEQLLGAARAALCIPSASRTGGSQTWHDQALTP